MPEDWKDDPWLIGYFLRNEPEFNFVENLKIADEVLRNPADTCCRSGLILFLQEKYGHIEALNNSWGSSFDSFDALRKPIGKCSEEYPDPSTISGRTPAFWCGNISAFHQKPAGRKIRTI